MHIAIEGMDGVGKTTVARLLAARTGFTIVEKPLHFLLDADDSMENYLRCRDYINGQTDNNPLRALFYGLGNLLLYQKFRGQDIITDRHLVSNYFWCGSPETEAFFEFLVNTIGYPDFTFLLLASPEEGVRRMKNRMQDDPDIEKAHLYSDAIVKMESFLVHNKMPYHKIDTTTLAPEDVVERILRCLHRNLTMTPDDHKTI